MRIEDVVALARAPLNDSDVDEGVTWSDGTIKDYVCAGLLRAYRNRPDLFIGGYDSPPTMSMALTDTFPLPDAYAEVIADYASARCLAHEDENAVNGKAAQFFALFGKEVG